MIHPFTQDATMQAPSRTRREEVQERVAAFLYLNPWSPAHFVGAALGLSGWWTRQALNEPSLVETVSVPKNPGGRYASASPRPFQVLYALTRDGELRSVGRVNPHAEKARVLVMAYERLAAARALVQWLYQADSLQPLWAISPWRPPGAGAETIDALLFVENPQNQDRYLLGLLLGPARATPDWYRAALRGWGRWRKQTNYRYPAVLAFVNPALDLSFVASLGRHSPLQNGGLLASRGQGGDDLWQPIHPIIRERVEPWPTMEHFAGAWLDPFEFVRLTRETPQKHLTLRQWAHGSRGKWTRMVEHLLTISYLGIETVDRVASFPGLNAREGRVLIGSQNQAKALNRLMQEEQARGLLAADPLDPKRYHLSAEGLEFLAALDGVSARNANRFLGWPLRSNLYMHQRAHTQLIQAIMSRLAGERALLAWEMFRCKYTYEEISARRGHRLARLVIYPDSAFAFLLGDGRYVNAWLEVDRGTRKGKRFTSQLERYFLVRFARYRPVPAPPVAYVVAPGDGSCEARLQSVVRRLDSLRAIYPKSNLRLALTTEDLLNGPPARDSLSQARIWRVYDNGGLHPETRSLGQALDPENS